MRAIPGNDVDTMLSGRIGIFLCEPFTVAVVGEIGDVGDSDPSVGVPLAFASAIADATGSFVSNRHPAGTQPCLDVSASIWPVPTGSRCTTHHPLARDRITNVSPLSIGKRQHRRKTSKA